MTMTAKARLLVIGGVIPLAACGGGGSDGGIASTPPPPPIMTQYSYDRVVDLPLKNHELAASVLVVEKDGDDYAITSSGQGLSINFNKADGTYALSLGDKNHSFSTTERETSTGPSVEAYVQVNANKTAILSLSRGPGVLMSYTMFGYWNDVDNLAGTAILRPFVTGSRTKSDDFPSGTATYTTDVASSTGMGTATLSANFQTGQLSTTLSLSGRPPLSIDVVDYGTYTGTAAISSATASYAGQLTGTRGTGAFSGGFFGPKAMETGYVWAIEGDTFDASGTVFGRLSQ